MRQTLVSVVLASTLAACSSHRFDNVLHHNNMPATVYDFNGTIHHVVDGVVEQEYVRFSTAGKTNVLEVKRYDGEIVEYRDLDATAHHSSLMTQKLSFLSS